MSTADYDTYKVHAVHNRAERKKRRNGLVIMPPTGRTPINQNQFLSKITQDQGPEFEQAIVGGFVNLGNVTTSVPLKTDRKIKQYIIQVRGRITVGAAPVAFRAGHPLLGSPLASLIQQITIFGQHNTFGAQTPIVIRAEDQAILMAYCNMPSYAPFVTVNGVRGGALNGAIGATNDFEINIPVPTHPMGPAETDQVLYGIHGPDWAGNLNMTLQFADPTALGVTLASLANAGQPTAFGSAAGTPSVRIFSVRPLLGKDLMARIQPSITFRLSDFQQINSLLTAGAAGANQKLRDLTIGKDTARVWIRTGTLLAGTTAGVTVIAPDLDTFLTQLAPSLDDRNFRFAGPNSNGVLQEYMGQMYQRTCPVGLLCIDFVNGTGPGAPNFKAQFASSNLTAARKFQMNADVALVGGTETGVVIQEMTLGQPQLS